MVSKVSYLGMKCVAYTMIICGEVKHVGFRRFIWGLAKRLNLSGYVRNLPDNCIEVYVEGDHQKIEELKDKVLNSRIYNVEDIKIAKSECKYLYEDFAILRCVGESEEFY